MGVGDPFERRTRSGLRASDEDRERAAARLRDHCAAGRLTAEELDERLGVCYQARTLGQLDALFYDLPGTLVPVPRERRLATRRLVGVPAGALALVGVLAALAVATDGHTAWVFWPVAFIWLRRTWWGRRRGGPRGPGGPGGPWRQDRTPGIPRWL